MSKILMPRYIFEFATTAARLAWVFEANDRGCQVFDHESGHIYVVKGGGSGAAAFSNLTGSDLVSVPLSLMDFLEVTSGGDPGAIAAIGGRLASDTTPILRGDAAESMEISWAAGNSDIIAYQFSFASQGILIDDTRDTYLDLDVYSGTTDVATMAVETTWNGGTVVVDSAVDAAASATRRRIRATIAAADIPTTVRQMTLMLTPPTHATNAIQLTGAVFSYFAQ